MRMLDCGAVQERYTDFIENTLQGDEQKLVEEHLAKCPPCQSLFKKLDTILQQLHSLPQAKTSSDFNQKLLTRIQEPGTDTLWTKVYHSPVARLGTYAAAAGLVVALLFTRWMEPVTNPDALPNIANTPQPDATSPVLAEEIDSSFSGTNDSLELTSPNNYIDPQKLQLVNENR